MDFSSLVTPELTEIVVGLVSTFLMYAIHQGAQYLKTKTKDQKIASALGMMDTMLTSAVKSTEQTLKKELVRANADGKLTELEKKKLRDDVLTTVQTNLTGSAKKEVLKVVPDIRQYLEGKMESVIHDIKASKYSGPIADTVIDSVVDIGVDAIKENIPEDILNSFSLDNK